MPQKKFRSRKSRDFGDDDSNPNLVPLGPRKSFGSDQEFGRPGNSRNRLNSNEERDFNESNGSDNFKGSKSPIFSRLGENRNFNSHNNSRNFTRHDRPRNFSRHEDQQNYEEHDDSMDYPGHDDRMGFPGPDDSRDYPEPDDPRDYSRNYPRSDDPREYSRDFARSDRSMDFQRSDRNSMNFPRPQGNFGNLPRPNGPAEFPRSDGNTRNFPSPDKQRGLLPLPVPPVSTSFPGSNVPGNFGPPNPPGNFAGPNAPGSFAPPNAPGNFAPPNAPGNFAPPNAPGNYAGPNAPGNFAGPNAPGNFAPPNAPGNFAPPNAPGNFAPPNAPGNFAPPNAPGNFVPLNVPRNFAPQNISGNFAPPNVPGNFAPPNGQFNPAPPNFPGNFPFSQRQQNVLGNENHNIQNFSNSSSSNQSTYTTDHPQSFCNFSVPPPRFVLKSKDSLSLPSDDSPLDASPSSSTSEDLPSEIDASCIPLPSLPPAVNLPLLEEQSVTAPVSTSVSDTQNSESDKISSQETEIPTSVERVDVFEEDEESHTNMDEETAEDKKVEASSDQENEVKVNKEDPNLPLESEIVSTGMSNAFKENTSQPVIDLVDVDDIEEADIDISKDIELDADEEVHKDKSDEIKENIEEVKDEIPKISELPVVKKVAEPHTSVTMRSPTRKFVLPCLGKEAAKKRLKAFYNSSALVKEKVKPSSIEAEKTKIENKEKKKKKEKQTFIEQIKVEEIRIKEVLYSAKSFESYHPGISNLSVLIGNPEALKKFEDRGKDFVQKMEKRKKDEEESEKVKDDQKHEEISKDTMDRDKSTSKSDLKRSRFNLSEYPQNWTDFKKLGISLEKLSRYAKDISKSRSRSPSQSRRDRKRRRSSSKELEDREVPVQKNLYPFPDTPLKLASVRLSRSDGGKEYRGGMVNYSRSKPVIQYCIDSKRYDNHYWSRNEVKIKNKNKPEILELIEEFWRSDAFKESDKPVRFSTWYKENYLEETASHADIEGTAEKRESSVLDSLSMDYANENIDHGEPLNTSRDSKSKDSLNKAVKDPKSSSKEKKAAKVPKQKKNKLSTKEKKKGKSSSSKNKSKTPDAKAGKEPKKSKKDKSSSKKKLKTGVKDSKSSKPKISPKTEEKISKKSEEVSFNEEYETFIDTLESNPAEDSSDGLYDINFQSMEEVPDRSKTKSVDVPELSDIPFIKPDTMSDVSKLSDTTSTNPDSITSADVPKSSTIPSSQLDAKIESKESNIPSLPTTKKEVKGLLQNTNLTKVERKTLKKLKKKMKLEKKEKKRLKKQLKLRLKMEKKQRKMDKSINDEFTEPHSNIIPTILGGQVESREMINTEEYMGMEYPTSDPQEMGYTTSHTQDIGYTTSQTQDIGYTTSQTQPMGYTTSEAENIGYTTSEVGDMGYATFETQDGSYTDGPDLINSSNLHAADYSITSVDCGRPKVDSIDTAEKSLIGDKLHSSGQRSTNFERIELDSSLNVMANLLPKPNVQYDAFPESKLEENVASTPHLKGSTEYYPPQNDNSVSPKVYTDSFVEDKKEDKSGSSLQERYSPSCMSFSSSDSEEDSLQQKHSSKPQNDSGKQSEPIVERSSLYSPSNPQISDSEEEPIVQPPALESIPMPPSLPATGIKVKESTPDQLISEINIPSVIKPPVIEESQRSSQIMEEKSQQPFTFRLGFKHSMALKKLPLPGFSLNDEEDQGNKSIPLHSFQEQPPELPATETQNIADPHLPKDNSSVVPDKEPIIKSSSHEEEKLQSTLPVNKEDQKVSSTEVSIPQSTEEGSGEVGGDKSKLKEKEVTETKDKVEGERSSRKRDSRSRSPRSSRSSYEKDRRHSPSSKDKRRSPSSRRRKRSRSPGNRRRSPDRYSSRRRSRSPQRKRHGDRGRRSPSPRYRTRSPSRRGRGSSHDRSPSKEKNRKLKSSSKSPLRDKTPADSQGSVSQSKDTSLDIEARPIASISNHFVKREQETNWHWEGIPDYPAPDEAAPKMKSESTSPKRLSLDERLKQEHGVEVQNDPEVAYPAQDPYWDYNSQMQGGYSTSSEVPQVIRVGNVLQVLPQESPQNVGSTMHYGNAAVQEGAGKGWRIEGIDADLSVPPPPIPQSPSIPPTPNPLSQFTSNPMAFISSLLASSSTKKPTEAENSSATESTEPVNEGPKTSKSPLKEYGMKEQQQIISAVVAASSGISNNPSIAQLLSVLQQQNLIGQPGNVAKTEEISTPVTVATLPVSADAVENLPTTDVDEPAPEPELDITVDLELFKEQRQERRERKRQEREARREAKRQKQILKKETEINRLRNEEEARRTNEKEDRNQETDEKAFDSDEDNIIKEAMTEVPELGSPVPDYELDDEDDMDEEEPKPRPVSLPPPPDRGILLLPFVGSGEANRKSVRFADGILPGYGTSPSGGEEIHSPPPPSAVDDSSRGRKKKKRSKKKIKVKLIKQFNEEVSEGIDSPPPPPEQPPNGGVIKLYPGCTHLTLTAPSTFVIYAQRAKATEAEGVSSPGADFMRESGLKIPAGMLIHSSALSKNFIPSFPADRLPAEPAHMNPLIHSTPNTDNGTIPVE